MEAPHAAAMPRFALRIAYDGTDFAGWWRQPDRRTVAGVLDQAFVRLGEPDAQAEGASRTDAGVHARAQLAHVDCRRTWDPAELTMRLNRHLPAEVAVRSVTVVADDWNAIAAIAHKTYRYRLDVGPTPDPFLARTAWRPAWSERLDHARLASAVALLPGERDWTAFIRRGERREATRCRMLRAGCTRTGDVLAIDLTASGFVYRLARSLVGACLLVARGGAEPEDLAVALAGTVNACAREQAPAHGLCLERIRLRR